MRNTILKGFALCLALNGLSFAATIKGSPTKSAPAPGTNSNTVPTSGAGTTERGLTPNSVTTGVSRLNGTVESVDQATGKVRVRDAQGKITEYQTNKDTTFSSNGKDRAITDVNPGDNVNLENNADMGVLRLDFGATKK